MQIYFAAPLFTAAERSWNAGLAAELRQHFPGHCFLVPQEFCGAQDPASSSDFGVIFQACRDHLLRADLVIAVLDGADSDSGTAWEMGYAHARGLPIIGFRSDFRPAEDGASNCMLSRSCQAIVNDVAGLVAAVEGVRS